MTDTPENLTTVDLDRKAIANSLRAETGVDIDFEDWDGLTDTEVLQRLSHTRTGEIGDDGNMLSLLDILGVERGSV